MYIKRVPEDDQTWIRYVIWNAMTASSFKNLSLLEGYITPPICVRRFAIDV